MKIELDLTPEQWWTLTSEADARGCTITELVASTSALTAEGRTVRKTALERLHANGLSDAAIGQHLGMTTTAVAVARRRLGLTANSRRREIALQRLNQEERNAS